MNEEIDIIQEARKNKKGRLTRMDILQTARRMQLALEKKDYSFKDALPSWSQIEELFGVSKAECMAEVEAYNDELYDDYAMTVELFLNVLGVPREDHRDVADGFWEVFPDGAVVGLDGDDPHLVLNSEKKQLWGYALAMFVNSTEDAPDAPDTEEPVDTPEEDSEGVDEE